jgi:hypothetical protein
MSAKSAFDYDIPFDIMVGHWVGTAGIYSRKGRYFMSTKSYVSIYWEEPYTKLSFRESAEDDYEFKGAASDYIDPREPEAIAKALGENAALAPDSGALRVLQYDLTVHGPHCCGESGAFSLDGRQTHPDAYSFHVKKEEDDGVYHHVYNSHHLPTPDDWHIMGPIVGPINGEDGEVGLAVVQFFRRISYKVPITSVCKLAPQQK